MEYCFDTCYRGKTVLVTGHTGFKGGWLVAWLKRLGAHVIGYALPSETDRPSLYETAAVADGMAASVMGDVRDLPALLAVFEKHQPEIVFHLAAQSLVRRSYAEPLETCSTNVMGTAHVLEAVHRTPSVRAVVVVTTDKCYENREWAFAYRENDPLGGHDLYSASKAAAEIVTASYRSSFFPAERIEAHGTGIASARAGNVIGGGDWAEDRLLPDCVRALAADTPIPVRSPHAIRPWQHVLEPLAGYLWLGACLWNDPARYGAAWNFGPGAEGNVTVREVVERVVEAWGAGASWTDVSESQQDALHEATFLKLDCTRAANLLHWRPVWSVPEAVEKTVNWYRSYYDDPDFAGADVTAAQIEAYVREARTLGVRWAAPPSVHKTHPEVA